MSVCDCVFCFCYVMRMQRSPKIEKYANAHTNVKLKCEVNLMCYCVCVCIQLSLVIVFGLLMFCFGLWAFRRGRVTRKHSQSHENESKSNGICAVVGTPPPSPLSSSPSHYHTQSPHVSVEPVRRSTSMPELHSPVAKMLHNTHLQVSNNTCDCVLCFVYCLPATVVVLIFQMNCFVLFLCCFV